MGKGGQFTWIFHIKPRKSKRGVWSTSTLSTMLRHKGYIGEGHWGSSYAVVPQNPFSKEIYRKVRKSSRKIRPEDEWHIIKIPPIIDRTLFEAAGDQLVKNFKQCKRNTTNQYLLSHKIYCICGQRRCGEGPRQGKFLYYRCNDRVNNFPLPRTCFEKGINARIADELVWQKITALMTSPTLLLEQLDSWIKSRQENSAHEETDIKAIEQQIMRLNEEENRYNKAYGAGLFTVEKLREYVVPLQDKIKSLEEQKKTHYNKQKESMTISVPDEETIEAFAVKAKQALYNLSFEAKRSILLNVVEKIVATQEELKVYGHIPITKINNVELLTNDRYAGYANRQYVARLDGVPFKCILPLPPPIYVNRKGYRRLKKQKNGKVLS